MNIMNFAVFNGTPPPVDRENGAVRTTVEPIRDAPIAETDTDYNAVVVDTSAELTGISRTVAAPDNTPSRQAPPQPYVTDVTSIIDDNYASAGRAPALESAGVRGHGSMQYDASIEPVVREGAVLGGDYFLSNNKPVQDGASDYMNPAVVDNIWSATAQAMGTRAARKANAATLYSPLVGG